MLELSVRHLYVLMESGQLASYRSGRSRRIPVAAINEYIERKLAEDGGRWQGRAHRERNVSADQHNTETK
jgi:excisionase family DNA binding protein